MNGLLSEWCNDSWDSKNEVRYPEREDKTINPLVWKKTARSRVLRGGNFLAEGSGKICRNTARTGAQGEYRSPLLGFRFVRAL